MGSAALLGLALAAGPSAAGEAPPLAHHEVRADRLAAPGRSSTNPPQVVARPRGASLRVPPGFAIDPWAEGLEGPRALALAPDGRVFVSLSYAGQVVTLADRDGDGRAEARIVFASGLAQP